jgi:membrane protease YdiL (CAAX protease family)
MSTLPPPIPGTAFGSPTDVAPATPALFPTLPLVAAVGAMGVLSGSLIVSKYLLDSIVGFGWPVAVYVVVLAAVGYGPSLWWCRFASRRWGTGDLGTDIGLTPRVADLGWGPVIWIGAVGTQIVVGVVIVALGVPLVSNTEGIEEISANRTYVVSLVIAAVIAAPVVEEMVFRGVVMRGLRSRLPIVVVVVVQGLLFGAAHIDPVRGVGNIGLVLVLGGVGVAFGVAVALLGRIGPSIVAHVLFNGAVLLVVLTGVADRLDAASVSAGEQVGVVDQTHIAEPGGDGDAYPSRPPMVDLEPIDRAQVAGIEDGDVVELCERLVADHTGGGTDHVGHARTV